MDPGKLSGPSRKYQFWLKCEKIELLKLFQVYISTDDDEKRLPEVQQCVSAGDDLEQFLKDKEKDAGVLEGFIEILKQNMEQELQREHDKFRKALKEQNTWMNKWKKKVSVPDIKHHVTLCTDQVPKKYTG